MHPRAHLLLTTVVAAGVRPKLDALTLAFWAGGVLADVDHLVWHTLRTGRVHPRAAWNHFTGEGEGERPAGALLFHRWSVILAGLACVPLAEPLAAFAAGLAFHRLLDSLDARFGPRRYSPSVLRRQELHRAVFDRASWRCEACGASGVKLEAHHRVPREAGGRDTVDNLVALCEACHRAAHAAPERPYNSTPKGGYS